MTILDLRFLVSFVDVGQKQLLYKKKRFDKINQIFKQILQNCFLVDYAFMTSAKNENVFVMVYLYMSQNGLNDTI